MTQEDLIRHGAAIERLIEDKAVQAVLDAQDAVYYARWKAATTTEERELLWAKASALGDFRQSLETSVAVGQHEASALERQERLDAAERAGRQH